MWNRFLKFLGLGPGMDVSQYLSDGPALVGHFRAVLRGPDGEVKDVRAGRNKIVTVGLYHVADQLADQGESAMSHMAIGFGTTAPVAGDTTLESEQDRNALTSTTQGTDTDADDVVYVGDFGAGEGTGAVTEAGILNAAAAGILLCRQVFSAINKAADDSLEITWTISVSEVV